MRKLSSFLLALLFSVNVFADGATRNECTSLGLSPELASRMCDGRTASASAAGNNSQTSAYAINTSVTIFTTVTNGTADSARLPAKTANPRDDLIIVNNGSGNLKLFPPVGSSILPLSANSALTVASGGTVYAKRVSPTSFMAIGLGTFTGASNPGQALAANTIASSGTIASTAVVQRVTTAGAVTGVIVSPASINGQQLYVLLDKDAAGSITMAAVGTSNVCGGVNVVIAVGGGAHFVYDTNDGCWNAVGIGTV